MTDLNLLAATLQVSDRTLRRAAARGTIRCIRHGERRLELPIHEALYLERHWPIFDILVRFAEPSLRARTQLAARLEEATGRTVQIVEIGDADPTLVADLLRDGRVLVDRGNEWAGLVARAPEVDAQAECAHNALERDVYNELEELLSRGDV